MACLWTNWSAGNSRAETEGCRRAPLWRRSYYDHIIRDEKDFLIRWNYIDTNPARWGEDEYA